MSIVQSRPETNAPRGSDRGGATRFGHRELPEFAELRRRRSGAWAAHACSMDAWRAVKCASHTALRRCAQRARLASQSRRNRFTLAVARGRDRCEGLAHVHELRRGAHGQRSPGAAVRLRSTRVPLSLPCHVARRVVVDDSARLFWLRRFSDAEIGRAPTDQGPRTGCKDQLRGPGLRDRHPRSGGGRWPWSRTHRRHGQSAARNPKLITPSPGENVSDDSGCGYTAGTNEPPQAHTNAHHRGGSSRRFPLQTRELRSTRRIVLERPM